MFVRWKDPTCHWSWLGSCWSSSFWLTRDKLKDAKANNDKRQHFCVTIIVQLCEEFKCFVHLSVFHSPNQSSRWAFTDLVSSYSLKKIKYKTHIVCIYRTTNPHVQAQMYLKVILTRPADCKALHARFWLVCTRSDTCETVISALYTKSCFKTPPFIGS